MKTRNMYCLLLFSLVLTLFSCKEKPEGPAALNFAFDLQLTNLKQLPSGNYYEIWSTTNINTTIPFKVGTFTVDANGELSKTEFEFYSTVQDPPLNIVVGPSHDENLGQGLYYGAFTDDTAILKNPIFPEGALDSVQMASGGFFLGTPTDGDPTLNETAGIWWGDQNGQSTLSLPVLQNLGFPWLYSVSVELDGEVLEFGRFSSGGEDLECGFCATTAAGYSVTGMDFLVEPNFNYNDNFTFPITDLSGGIVRVALVPYDGTPFVSCPNTHFTILEATIPQNATPNTPFQMTQNPSDFEVGGVVIRRRM